ncbi:MAG: proprotein convertase P-domain-containing protein, partial [Acidobacteriota bacterium]|nr:proprotein convertase P-domain-containing protein [Acidobacteriota bacterium]
MRPRTWFGSILKGCAVLGLGVLMSCSGGGGGSQPPPTPAPVISGFTPSSAGPGEAVTISGSNLSGASVKFNGTPATITSNTASQIVTAVPAGATNGPISVTTAGGTATSGVSFMINQAPSAPVIAFSGGQQITGHPSFYTLTSTDPEGDPITYSVTGTGTTLTGNTVTLNTATAGTATFSAIANDSHNNHSAAANQSVVIAANRPPQFTSVPTGQLTGPSSAINWTSFIVTAQDPDGDDVAYAITGTPTFVDNTGGSAGIVGAIAIHATSGAVTFTGTVPPGKTSVAATFTVLATDKLVGTGTILGATATQTVALTYNLNTQPPTITGFAPPSGPVGTSVVITGTNLSGASLVKFNNVASTFTVNSATQITATVPTTTTGPIAVTTPSGTATSTTNFTVTPSGGSPTISGLNVGSALPGLPVVITGTNLGGATAVRFNGLSALFIQDSATQITALVPTGATSGFVTVQTPSGTATSPASFTVSAYPTNQQSYSTPTAIPDATSGTVFGTPVLIPFTVSGLSYPVRDVQISIHITHTFVGDLDLQLIAPDNTAISLAASRDDNKANYGSGCAPGQYTVFSDSGAGPLSGPAPYNGTFKPAQALSALAGKTANGTWTLRIQDQGPADTGNFVCASLVVTAGPRPPTIAGFNPTMGPNGTTVLLTGTHLAGTSALSIGNVAAASPTNVTDTSLTFTVPSGAPVAPLRLIAPAGTAISARAFTPTASGPTADLFIDGAYVTQSAQNYMGGVPLVAGKDGVLRVFARGNQAGIPAPSVRVRTYNGATLSGTQTISPIAGNAPTGVSEGSMSQSWNYTLPGASIQPGLGLLLDVDPANAIPEADETNNTWPPSGTPMAMDVRSLQTFHGTLIPVTQNSLTGNATPGNLASWYAKFQKMYPVAPAMDVVLGAPYTTSQVLVHDDANHGWSNLLGELEAKRVVEASTRYYYGALNVSYGSGVAGLGYVPSAGSSAPRSAMGWDKTTGYADGGLYFDVLTHETGHNMGRAHSPCGGAAGPDPAYPYAGALIGIWGLDVAAMSLKDPAVYTDIMAYCSPVWVSDYVYHSILDFRQASPYGIAPPLATPADAAQASATSPQDCLLVSGRIHNGNVELDPALQVRTVPTLLEGKAKKGSRLIEGRDASGKLIFQRSLPLMQVAEDIPGSLDQHFIAAIPVADFPVHELNELRVLGDWGVEAIRWSSQVLPLKSGAVQLPQVQVFGEGEVRLTWDAGAHPL